jgi:hypothetical protein
MTCLASVIDGLGSWIAKTTKTEEIGLDWFFQFTKNRSVIVQKKSKFDFLIVKPEKPSDR